MVVPLDIMDLNLQLMLNTLVQHYSIPPSLMNPLKRRYVEAGHILGPFDDPPLPNLRCSGLGAIPEHDGG